VTLTRSNTNVKVFTASTGGTEITFSSGDNNFDDDDLPKSLYVEGATGSSSMRDVTLTLTDEEEKSDTVKFTVLWVALSQRHSNDASEDNSARETYRDLGVPQVGHALGAPRLTSNVGVEAQPTAHYANTTLGSEFVGTVYPSNFKPSEFGGDLKMRRRLVNAFLYKGPNGNEGGRPYGPGSDNSHESMRDDDPQSDESGGKIYDLDCPGPPAMSMPTGITAIQSGDIIRFRANFYAWAEYGGQRCSVEDPWHSHQSYKLQADEWTTGTTDSSSANSITEDGAGWTNDEWKPGMIWINTGTGQGQVRRISGNDDDTITVTPNWAVNPDGGYVVINNDAWQQDDSVPNDNSNGSGHTKMSWDLKSPTVTAIAPNTGQTGTSVEVEITGTSFAGGAGSNSSSTPRNPN